MKRRKNFTKRTAKTAHIPAGLLYIGSCFPRGLNTMIMLARQSRNPGIRTVMETWLSLDDERRAEIELEDLCWATGIDDGAFLGDVMGTAFELGMDISGVFDGMAAMPTLMVSCLMHATRSNDGVDSAVRAIKFIDRLVQHLRER
jgi:hypothetical protein